MPVITFANPKGGSSKSTSCLVLGQALASAGASVAIVDADPNHPLVDWRHGPSRSTITIVPDVTESSIIRTVDAARQSHRFVLVDLEGTASRMVSRAISCADLTIIPLQPSGLDAKQAARAVDLIREEEELLRRSVPFRVLVTRTSVLIPTTLERKIKASLLAADLPCFQQHLHERQAYKLIFDRRLALDEMTDVKGIDRAIGEADSLAAELAAVLTEAAHVG